MHQLVGLPAIRKQRIIYLYFLDKNRKNIATTKFKSGNWVFIFLLFFGITMLGNNHDSLAQSARKKSNREVKKNEKKRRKKIDKLHVNKKSKSLQRYYYGQKSRQVQRNPGITEMQPKSRQRDFNAIKERTEPNPSRKNLRAYKSAKKNLKYGSKKVQKGYGSEPELLYSKKGAYKFGSSVISKHSGQMELKSKKRTYKKQSRQNLQSGGNIAVQPRSLQRNYDDIRKRTDKNPSKTQKQLSREKQAKYAASTGISKHQGDQIIAKKQSKLAGKYNSQVIIKHTGDLPVKSAKRASAKRAANSGATFSGQFKALTPKQRKQALEGKSMNVTKDEGSYKRLSKSAEKRHQRNTSFAMRFGGNYKGLTPNQRKQALEGKSLNITSNQGNIKSTRKSDKRWFKMYSKYSSQYQGDYKWYTKKQKDQMMEGKALNIASYQGEINRKKIKDKSHTTEMTLNYHGNYKYESPKQRKQALQGKSLNLADYQGELKDTHKKKESYFKFHAKVLSSYQGDFKGKTKKQKDQMLEGKSLNLASYSGELKQTRKKDESYYKFHSNVVSNYQGEYKWYTKKQKDQMLQGKSYNMTLHEGNLKFISKKKKDNYYREMSARNQQMAVNYRLKYKFVKDLEHQYLSATVHNYQGGAKTSLFNRLWLKMFDKGDKLQKADNTVKEPKYDTRESEIWYE